MEIEGELLKRYRLSYCGELIGSYDTAKETLEEYDQHNKFLRPITDPNNKGRYLIRDGYADWLRRAATAPRGPAALDGSSERVGRVSPDSSSRYREPFAQKDRLKNRFNLAFSNGEAG